MDASLKLQWNFSFSAEELLLICKALRCNLTEDELPKALELDATIARIRVGLTKARLNEINKLERNLEST